MAASRTRGKQSQSGNEGSLVTSPATPVTGTTATGFNKKGFEDSSRFPPLPVPVVHAPLVPEELKFLSGDQLKKLGDLSSTRSSGLNQGCYLVNFSPAGTSFHYDGTLRVQKASSATIASGDLYYHNSLPAWPAVSSNGDPGVFHSNLQPSKLPGEPNPSQGIPVFARTDYRYYLKVTQVLEPLGFTKALTLGFQMWKFSGPSSTPMWKNEGSFKAELSSLPAPPGYPRDDDYLSGPVKNAANTIVGHLSMGWISEYLRAITVEIDRMAGSEAPMESGAGHTWNTIFGQVNWKVNLIESNKTVTRAAGNAWTDGELHAAMLKWRDSADLDSEWRYHILAVKAIESTPRGLMYDAYAGDSNNIPREGIGIASDWIIPKESMWGKVQGKRFGLAKAAYFRTALHEIGHAMGLYHNTADMGIMNTTDVIAASARGSVQFPDNIKWSFAADDQKRLRHMPDIYVRPGGVPFGSSYSVHPLITDDETEEAVGLHLSVKPVHDVIPVGAPVRLEIMLENISDNYLPGPASLNMKFGCVRGKAIDSTGNVRTFTPLVICMDEVPVRYLAPREKLTESLTLLRGVEGALFANAGSYTIEIEVSWDMNEGHVSVSGETNVYVTSAKDEEHARAAMKILSTPDTLLSLAITGDHITKGNDAIQVALQNKVLRPHYLYVEAKRLAQSSGERSPDIAAAAKLLSQDSVMSSSEIKKAVRLLKKENGASDQTPVNTAVSALRSKAEKTGMKDDQLNRIFA